MATDLGADRAPDAADRPPGAPGATTHDPSPRPGADDAPAHPAWPDRYLRWLTPDRARWVLPLIVVLFAAVLRFAYLPHPERIYFDETYYATNAAQVLTWGVEAEPRVEGDPSQGLDPVFVVHPPLGKWAIAAGIAVFGDNSLGWRFSSAVAGTLLVAVTYAIALRLLRRRAVAALTAFLLAIEGLALTMSRISMLDIFLALFVALGAWALLIDRDRRWALVPDPPATVDDDQPDPDDPDGATSPGSADVDADAAHPGGPDDSDEVSGPPPTSDRPILLTRLPRLPRTHVWLAGLAFGLALATKVSALLAIAAAGLFLLASELAWRRALLGSWRRQLWRIVALGVGALLVLPLVTYVASYASWFANYERTRPGVAACDEAAETCTAGVGDMARGWFGEQQDIYRFHRDLEVTHDYRASAALWPITKRPVVYYYEACLDPEPGASCDVPPGTLEEIIGLGNPAVWWLTLPVYPFLLWAAVRRRDRVAATIAVFLFVQYLPWLAQTRPLFYFYALPLVPFVLLTWGWAATQLLGRRGLRWVPVGAAALALAAFVFWAPVYYGMQITEAGWRLRMWFNSWI